MPTKLKFIYQLRITLVGVEPEIWRTVLVPSSIKLPKLHTVIQVAMGWLDSHLHVFNGNGESYGEPDEYDELGIKDEKSVQMSKLLSSEGDKIVYEYDFGDGWQHDVILEKILPFDTVAKMPLCIDGERACPPEDCGGVYGYRNLLEIITDPDHEEFESMNEWLGDGFASEAFNLAETNELLLKYAKC